MKIVKRFNDFLRKNENSLNPEMTDGMLSTIENEENDSQNIVDEIPEEEEVDPIQQMMEEILKRLGRDAKMVENYIEYEGHKIEYFSETESFAIDNNVYFKKGGKKVKLISVNDVVDYFQQELKPFTESRKNFRKK